MKVTIETTDEDYFEFMKFKNAKGGIALLRIFTNECSPRTYQQVQSTEVLQVLTKPEVFEKVNQKIQAMEVEIYDLRIKNDILKEDLDIANHKLITRKTFLGIPISK